LLGSSVLTAATSSRSGNGLIKQRVVLLLQPREPGLVTLHLRLQLLEIQDV
jgi:hypothetical protein